MQFDVPSENRSIIKVIGIGGGGSNAVNHMFKQGIEGVEFAIANTDVQSMEESKIPIKLQLGPELTKGRGAGSLPDVGKKACIESIDQVREFLEDGTKMLFITAGMGGGTGTGAAPIVAKTAKDMGILTVAIITLPFKFEGSKRNHHALSGMDQLKENVDAILVISNDKVRTMYGNLQLSEAFAQADQILTTAAKGIAEIITLPGYINVDFEDVNTVMRDSGVAIMGSAEKEGENRAREAIDAALNSPLLEDSDIRGATHILLNITSGTNEVTMDEVAEITEYIQEEAGRGTDLIWGNCLDESLGEKISITLIATGFDKKENSFEEKVPRSVKLDDDVREEMVESIRLEPEMPNEELVMEFGEDDIKATIDKYNGKSNPYFKDDAYEERKKRLKELENKRPKEQPRKEIKLGPDVSMDNTDNLKGLEETPAYKRRKIKLDSVKSSDDRRENDYRVTIDGEEMDDSGNHFLHAKAD